MLYVKSFSIFFQSTKEAKKISIEVILKNKLELF